MDAGSELTSQISAAILMIQSLVPLVRSVLLTEHDELHGDATATSQSAAVKKISVCTSHSES